MAQIRVNPGDSLWKIAKRNPSPGVSITERIRQIAAASGVTDPNAIKPGQVLIVPGGDEGPTPRPRPDPIALSAARQMDTRGGRPMAPTPARPETAGAMPGASRPPAFGDLTSAMTDKFGAGNVQVTPPEREFATNRAPAAASAVTPPIGNENYPDPMAAELMTPPPPDFAAADPAGTAGQVMGLPEEMNPAFPDSGAETPVADAMNQSQVLTSMDPAQRQALISMLMGMQGQGM